MASSLLHAELTATCNSLGCFTESKYFCEPHCAETAKDLIRYLRRDGESHEIRLFLGNTNVFQTDLLPIIQYHSDNQQLFDIVIRLLTNLTTPALIVYKEKVPKDRAERNRFLELVRHLQSYKEALADPKPWQVIAKKLASFLTKVEQGTQDEDNVRSIERILILVRNILHVPAGADYDSRPDNDASLHDQVLWSLHQSGMLDILLYMASSQLESLFFMHVMEIICLMVREQSAAGLAKSAPQRSTEERAEDSRELDSLRQQEAKAKMDKMRKYRSTRHFGGTFVIKNMKSTSEKDLIYHKPLTNMNNISLDLEKKRTKLPNKKLPLKWESCERKSALSVRLILKQFCMEILNAAYNPLMKFIKDNLVRGAKQDGDESFYFTAMRFFMEFNRHHRFQVKLVSETLTVETFHFIHKYLEEWHGLMLTDKEKIPLWSSRKHVALNAYKELLYYLGAMEKYPDEGVRDSARVLMSNIFYVIEYREMILVMMNTFKKNQYSIQYAKDLLETAHVFLKIFEKFGKNKKIFVQKKASKIRKKKKSTQVNKSGPVLEESPEVSWPDISENLEQILGRPVNVQIIPFDAAADISMEQQKVDAAKRISFYLKSNRLEEAVSLLRAAREVWPENDSFGKLDSLLSEELETLQEIFQADLGKPEFMKEEPVAEGSDNEEEYDAEEEEERYMPAVEERSINVEDFLNSFANPRVLYVCGLLLRHYQTNTVLINHCIAKMLHRVAVDCKMPAMLFQASIFRSFQRIFAETDPKYQELKTLGKFIVRKFTEVAAKNKKLLSEMLFWKSSKQAYDIEMGYGSFNDMKTKSKASHHMWEEHEEDELRHLYMEFKRDFPEGSNMVSWITTNLIKDRSEKAVLKKLKEMHLIDPKLDKKKLVWTEEEEAELRQLYEEYRNDIDPLEKLVEALPNRKKIDIKKTLLRIGAVADFKELRKKRPSKKLLAGSGKSDTRRSDSSSDNDDEDRESEDRDIDRERLRDATERPTISSAVSGILVATANTAATTYMVGGLEWLLESLKEALEEDDDDEDEHVVLVPIGDTASRSLSDSSFKAFLLSIGVHPPIAGLESYWRVPSSWRAGDYNKAIKLIETISKSCEAGEETISEEIRDVIKDFGEEATQTDALSGNESVDEEYKKVMSEAGSRGTRRRFDSGSSIENDPPNGWRENSSAPSESARKLSRAPRKRRNSGSSESEAPSLQWREQSPAFSEASNLSRARKNTPKEKSASKRKPPKVTRKRKDSGSSDSEAPPLQWQEQSPAFSEASNLSRINTDAPKEKTSKKKTSKVSRKRKDSDSSGSDAPSFQWREQSPAFSEASNVSKVKKDTPKEKSSSQKKVSKVSKKSYDSDSSDNEHTPLKSEVSSIANSAMSSPTSTPSSRASKASFKKSKRSLSPSSALSTPVSRKSGSKSASSTPTSKRSSKSSVLSPASSVSSSKRSSPVSQKSISSAANTTLRDSSESENEMETTVISRRRNAIDSSDDESAAANPSVDPENTNNSTDTSKRDRSLSDSDGDKKSPFVKKKKRIAIESDEDD